MTPDPCVWVFNGEGGRFPSGVFSTRERAEAWITAHQLTGVLTAYPLDEGTLDWVLRSDLPAGNLQAKATNARFVGAFSSAYQAHVHYEAGLPIG